jgi:hypothetical protein
MKYLLMIWSNPQTWGHPIFLRTPEAAAMTDDERAGMLRDFEELMAEISESGELVTAGPIASSKEQMAGDFIVVCATRVRAEEIAGRFPDARFAAVEVRPLMGGSAEDL